MDKQVIADMVMQTLRAAEQALKVAQQDPEVWALIKFEYNQAFSNFERAAIHVGKLNKE